MQKNLFADFVFLFSGIFLPQSLHFASFTPFVCISPVDTSTMSTLKTGNALLSKALTKARYAHQCDFLNQCLHNKVISKGLNIGLKVNFPGNPSLRVQKRAQGILRKSSFDIMNLLLGQYRSLAGNLDCSLDKLRDQLGVSIGAGESQSVLSSVKLQTKREETRLLKKRQKS